MTKAVGWLWRGRQREVVVWLLVRAGGDLFDRTFISQSENRRAERIISEQQQSSSRSRAPVLIRLYYN